jgi:hypothetical protein
LEIGVQKLTLSVSFQVDTQHRKKQVIAAWLLMPAVFSGAVIAFQIAPASRSSKYRSFPANWSHRTRVAGLSAHNPRRTLQASIAANVSVERAVAPVQKFNAAGEKLVLN